MAFRVNIKTWCVYILKLDNGNLYTGITKNLKRRLQQHRSKRSGAKYVRGKNFTLVYHSAKAYDHKTAAQMEYNLKRKRNKYFKLRLIKNKPLFLHKYLTSHCDELGRTLLSFG